MSSQEDKKPKQASTAPAQFRHEGHSIRSRRDFLSQTIGGMAAYSLMPSAVSMLLTEHSARAATCPVGGASNGAIPFLVFDCAGGAALSGNWVPLDAGGNLLAATKYTKLGLGDEVPGVTTAFGAPMAGDLSQPTQISKVLEGILATTTPEARACLRMGGMPHQSQSDTGANQSSAVGYIASLGLQGTLVRSPLGTSASMSGGNSDVAFADATLKPLQVRSIDTLLGTVNYQATLANLPATQLRAMAKAALGLSKSQAQKLATMTLGQEFSTLMECGMTKNQQLAANAAVDATTGRVNKNAVVDPRMDATMQSIYTLTATSSPSSSDSIAAGIVYNCLKGYSGPGTIVIGGCDYHDGTQTTGDAKDLQIGRHIGRAVQAAYMMGKKLAFQVLSDGGIYSDPSTRMWRGDINSNGFTVFGYMDPKGAMKMTRSQIGNVTPNAVADTTTYIGNSPARMSQAVLANYLNLIGKLGMMESLVGAGQLPSDLKSLLLFG
jgi:hypothetical protein